MPVASGPATRSEIRWQGLRVLRRDRHFSDRLEAHDRAHWLIPHLRKTPSLRYLPETSMRRVAEATELRSFGRIEWNAEYRKTRRLPPGEQIASEPLVADEGCEPTELMIVRSGFGRVCQAYGAGHRTVAYLGKGHPFGTAEIAHNVLRPEGVPSKPLTSRTGGTVRTREFEPLPLSTCSSCHDRGGAPDRCTTCHRYHQASRSPITWAGSTPVRR